LAQNWRENGNTKCTVYEMQSIDKEYSQILEIATAWNTHVFEN